MRHVYLAASIAMVTNVIAPALANGATATRPDVYNIADYGAAGDATSDNSALNLALTYAGLHPGTQILIPTGTWAFSVDSSNGYGFKIPSFTTLTGEDQNATTITWNDTAGVYLFSATSNTSAARTTSITFQNFTVKGTWGTATNGYTAYQIGNAPFLPTGVDGLTFDHITSEYSRGFGISARGSTNVTVRDSHTLQTFSDAINLSQTSNASINNNFIEHTDDDAISVHSDIYDTWGVRRHIEITGNHIFDAQGIDVEAARQANISDNTLDSIRQVGISVVTNPASSLTGPTEGNSADESILITGNKLTNLLNRQNIDNINQGVVGIVINGLSARAGQYSAAPGEAIALTGKVIDPYREFMANSQLPGVAVSGGHAILVANNMIMRDLPASNGGDSRYTQWTDFKQGLITSRIGPQNPKLAESDMEGACVALTGGSLRDVMITGNDCHGMSDGLSVAGSGNSHYADVVYRDNNVVDFTGHGILVNTAGKLSLIAENNLFNGDPFQKSPARGANGTWTNGSGPAGIYVQSGTGVTFRDNTLLNVAIDTNVDPTLPTGGCLIEGNIDEADPSVINSFSTANKGIAEVHSAGFRLAQLDSDPGSPTYDTLLSAPVSAAFSAPTAGKWMLGAYVRNAAPAATAPVGWLRLTTGSSNVPGIDWLAVQNANGGVSVNNGTATILPSGIITGTTATQGIGNNSGSLSSTAYVDRAVGTYAGVFTKTGSYVANVNDCGLVFLMNSGSSMTFTVSASWPIGCHLTVVQKGTGSVTINGVSGFIPYGAAGLTTSAQYARLDLLVDSSSTINVK